VRPGREERFPVGLINTTLGLDIDAGSKALSSRDKENRQCDSSVYNGVEKKEGSRDKREL
jgi:hypothetical protein